MADNKYAGTQTQDPFWDNAASMLLSALIYYLHYEAPPYEQNFTMVTELLREGDVDEERDKRDSVLDLLFGELERKDPYHIAVKYYNEYRSGAAKTLKSIQITLAARLEKFNLESLAAMTLTDELELDILGKEKTALFALIPDNDTSFNFLVSILYTQLFQQLFYVADHDYGGSLPVHVHFLMDEFANVSLPDDFDKILSVMRSRGVSVSIILQNLAQLKALFEKQWESIVGNCDELVYLGGNEQSTHKYISEQLGKATIDTNTYGRSDGMRGNFSTNFQLSGRELMTPDEVRMLDNKYCIAFIRGERPVLDYKYDITDNEKQMEEDIMKKMKESNGENFCRASGCGYARCFTGISPKYMAKMNKEDRNNFQTAIEEILEDLNLGGHVTAEPLMSERTKEYFDSYKDEAYYSLSPKKRKIVDMQQRGYIDEDGQIDEDAIYDDACEAAEELAVFLRAVFNNPKEDSKKLIKFLDNLWTAGKYKQLQATLIGFELLFEFPEK